MVYEVLETEFDTLKAGLKNGILIKTLMNNLVQSKWKTFLPTE
jgi:hypothetical protein